MEILGGEGEGAEKGWAVYNFFNSVIKMFLQHYVESAATLVRVQCNSPLISYLLHLHNKQVIKLYGSPV